MQSQNLRLVTPNQSESTPSYLELLAKVKLALDSATEVAVNAADIRPYPNQPRTHFNADSLRRLSESIDAGGQTTSGMIRSKPGETNYELIDGERRWRAIRMIPEDRRPLYKARLIKADDDVVQYLISGIANFNREGHTPLEAMETIDRLLSFNLPMKEIAALLGISEFWANQIHGLKKLEPNVSALLDPKLPKGEQIPVSAAIQISKIDPKLQAELATKVMSKDITLGRLRGEVVRLAKAEGVNIRLRELGPHKKWESFKNKTEVVTRTASDALAIIESNDIDGIIKSNPEMANLLFTKLEEAKKTCAMIQSMITIAKENI